MKKIKLSSLTKRRINMLKVFPIDVEDYTEETINECYPKVNLLNHIKKPQGLLIRQTDEIAFRLCCRDTERLELSEKRWIEIRGEFYDLEQIIQRLEDSGFTVENDL